MLISSRTALLGVVVVATLALSGCSSWKLWKSEPAAQEETVPEPVLIPEASAPAPTPEPPLPPTDSVIFGEEEPAAPAPETPAPEVPEAPVPPPEAPAPPAEAQTFEVIVPEGAYVFAPRELTIYEGDTVVWKNTSGIVHLFASIPGADGTDRMEIEPTDLLENGVVSHTFTKAGTYPYFCFIHNRMTGRIVVLKR